MPLLRIAAEIVYLWAAEIAKKQAAASCVSANPALVAGERIEWIESRADGWDAAADPIRLARRL